LIKTRSKTLLHQFQFDSQLFCLTQLTQDLSTHLPPAVTSTQVKNVLSHSNIPIRVP